MVQTEKDKDTGRSKESLLRFIPTKRSPDKKSTE
jgi:hypothetical protein